jgi:Phospholipase_D-nuclease N-terminal
MVLVCVLFTLITVGLVVPCVIDVATSPPWAIRTLTKRSWLLITVVFSVFGCAVWLVAGRPRRLPLRPRRAAAGLGISAAEAFLRHPATQAMSLDLNDPLGEGIARGSWRPGPAGPDDDDAFLLELERRIRESRDDR